MNRNRNNVINKTEQTDRQTDRQTGRQTCRHQTAALLLLAVDADSVTTLLVWWHKL